MVLVGMRNVDLFDFEEKNNVRSGSLADLRNRPHRIHMPIRSAIHLDYRHRARSCKFRLDCDRAGRRDCQL